MRVKFLTFFVSVSRIITIFKNMSLIIIISPFCFQGARAPPGRRA